MHITIDDDLRGVGHRTLRCAAVTTTLTPETLD